MGILIDKTPDCPYINFSESGLLEIEGRSITEDVFSFWQPLIDWVAQYILNPAPVTKVIIFLEYSNSSTNKYLNELMKLLDKCAANGSQVSILWRYEEEDESIQVLGQDLQALAKTKIDFEEVVLDKMKTRKVLVRSKKTGNEAEITYRYWDAIVRNGHGDDYIILHEED
jgi:hypothetical protein